MPEQLEDDHHADQAKLEHRCHDRLFPSGERGGTSPEEKSQGISQGIGADHAVDESVCTLVAVAGG
jgi:hypothetical protein